MSKNQFKKALNGVDSAIKQGTARALNRALSSTKTKVVRQLRQDTGLKKDVVSTRTRFRKAKIDSLDVVIGIATKFGIPLRQFAAKAKNVRSAMGRRIGATTKIGRQNRQLVPGGFLMNVGATTIVAGRTKAFSGLGSGEGTYTDSKAARAPTTQLKTRAFSESAKDLQGPSEKHLKDTFERIVAHEIEYSVSRKLKQSK